MPHFRTSSNIFTVIIFHLLHQSNLASIINEINWMSSVWFQLINEIKPDWLQQIHPFHSASFNFSLIACRNGASKQFQQTEFKLNLRNENGMGYSNGCFGVLAGLNWFVWLVGFIDWLIQFGFINGNESNFSNHQSTKSNNQFQPIDVKSSSIQLYYHPACCLLSFPLSSGHYASSIFKIFYRQYRICSTKYCWDNLWR